MPEMVLDLAGGDLLDEPLAAFLDYLLTHPGEVARSPAAKKNLVVFDFGGGTCDVAVFRLARREGESGGLSISPLAVSRYHRLGGGDLDRAIVHEVLLPQLLEQNGLSEFDLDYEARKTFVEPAFLSVAEALKTGLCTEIHRLESFGQYAGADKNTVVKRQPGVHACRLKDRTLSLQSPSLTAAAFERLLVRFLDRDLLYARETEYYLTCSVFAPLQDALERGGLAPEAVDLCLMVGGSSLIPQVAAAVRAYFPKAKTLTYADRESVQVAVARGAAYHALALALYGRSVFGVVAPDPVSIRTRGGLRELLPRGAALPFPADGGWARCSDLIVPESSLLDPVELRVEILAGQDEDTRPLLRRLWSVPPPVDRGAALLLEYRVDENQVFECRLTLADTPDAPPFAERIENPLTNVVNPHARRLKIQQAEEDLRTNQVPRPQIPDKIVEIAHDYSELRQTDKAIDYLQRAMRMKNAPDPHLLNLLGIYHGQRGDHERQEKFYRESAEVAPHDHAPLFNLALAQHHRGKFEEAAASVLESIARRAGGPAYTLQAMTAAALKKPHVRATALRQALDAFDEPRGMTDWELGWFATAARLAADSAKMQAALDEQARRRAGKSDADTDEAGQLPGVAETLATRP